MSCHDPWRHQSEGRDAARYGERYDWEHRDRMHNARYGDYDSCDRYYAEGYEAELRQQRERREQEEYEERRANESAMERAAYEYEVYLEEQAHYEELARQQGEADA